MRALSTCGEANGVRTLVNPTPFPLFSLHRWCVRAMGQLAMHGLLVNVVGSVMSQQSTTPHAYLTAVGVAPLSGLEPFTRANRFVRPSDTRAPIFLCSRNACTCIIAVATKAGNGCFPAHRNFSIRKFDRARKGFGKDGNFWNPRALRTAVWLRPLRPFVHMGVNVGWHGADNGRRAVRLGAQGLTVGPR